MTSLVQHKQNEIVSTYSYCIWIYGPQVVKLQENTAALLETTVQGKATSDQAIHTVRAQSSTRSCCKYQNNNNNNKKTPYY